MWSRLKTLRIVKISSIIFLGSTTLTGCAASRMMIRYGDLDTRTEMSESIFLELRSDLPQTVYVAEASTAGQDLTIRPSLERALTASGYAVVETPEEATYLIQVNHLSLEEIELGDQSLGDALGSSLTAGFGAALAADVFGASNAAGQFGLAVGVLGFILDSSTKHIAHTITTDVRLTERVSADGVEGEPRFHETRIISGASKVNLSLEDGLPSMINGMSGALAGLLPTQAPR